MEEALKNIDTTENTTENNDFEVGSHSLDHSNLNHLDENKLIIQLSESKKFLKLNLILMLNLFHIRMEYIIKILFNLLKNITDMLLLPREVDLDLASLIYLKYLEFP